MIDRKIKMQDIFAALTALLKEHGDIDVVREAAAFAAWKKVAGESLSEHTSPVAFTENKLTIAVADRTWQRNLKGLSAEMIFRINSTMGSSFVKFIEFTIDKSVVQDVKTPDAERAGFELKVLYEITDRLKESADIIQDGEMRRKFLLAAGSCLAREKRMGDAR